MRAKKPGKPKSPTNNSIFDEFKDECNRQIERLGLKDWDIEIRQEQMCGEDETNAANTQFTEKGRVAVITMNSAFPPDNPRQVAKHEVAHVLLGRLNLVAENRFITEEELADAIESVCTRLEKVL